MLDSIGNSATSSSSRRLAETCSSRTMSSSAAQTPDRMSESCAARTQRLRGHIKPAQAIFERAYSFDSPGPDQPLIHRDSLIRPACARAEKRTKSPRAGRLWGFKSSGRQLNDFRINGMQSSFSFVPKMCPKETHRNRSVWRRNGHNTLVVLSPRPRSVQTARKPRLRIEDNP